MELGTDPGHLVNNRMQLQNARIIYTYMTRQTTCTYGNRGGGAAAAY